MCVIMCKPKGIDFPSASIIATCIRTNPDGFSMAWNAGNKVYNFKTMDRKEALAKYAELSESLNPEESSLIFHARIATHGSKQEKNCHCWIKEGIAFAHNGILHNVPARGDMTDSETFFEDYFIPAIKAYGWKYAKLISEAIIGTSRFALLDKTGRLITLGSGWIAYGEPHHKGQCLYSNGSFRDWRDNSLFGRSYTPSRNICRPTHRTEMSDYVDNIIDSL